MEDKYRKYLVMDMAGVEELMKIIKAGSPPSNMSKEEWINQIGACILESKRRVEPNFIKTQSYLRAERISQAINSVMCPSNSIQALDNP